MRNNTYIPNRKLVEAFRNKYFIVIQQSDLFVVKVEL